MIMVGLHSATKRVMVGSHRSLVPPKMYCFPHGPVYLKIFVWVALTNRFMVGSHSVTKDLRLAAVIFEIFLEKSTL